MSISHGMGYIHLFPDVCPRGGGLASGPSGHGSFLFSKVCHVMLTSVLGISNPLVIIN